MTGKQKIFDKHRIRVDRINPLIAAIAIGCGMFLQATAVSAVRSQLSDKSAVVVAVDVGGGGQSFATRPFAEEPKAASNLASSK
ncbi:MAG: hypothetical protein WAO58_03515 [Fimbriimonadaceae bacterium]